MGHLKKEPLVLSSAAFHTWTLGRSGEGVHRFKSEATETLLGPPDLRHLEFLPRIPSGSPFPNLGRGWRRLALSNPAQATSGWTTLPWMSVKR